MRLAPVTEDNYRAVIGLEVHEDQRTFVATNLKSIADAWVHRPKLQPLALYHGEDLVGFTLLERDSPDVLHIARFMIDRRAQGRGLGRKGLAAIAELARAEGRSELALGVVPANAVARGLYAAFGFTETGEVDGGELVMRHRLAPSAHLAGDL
ncbi:GNAT family N-acetyltransferase [Saccharothrix syringae]|uniref:GNAT family N-acetyltransferase n=1 Tax=Saccharothrix syringae TaxID=103733 RepID=A0A5Q0GWF2_SACSY|nr:GNAT family N-acetyltransferase [Saccharothrix syringae]QFZ17985.1 GNAT family N-acetyltransferase [Saccharothrix syringae]